MNRAIETGDATGELSAWQQMLTRWDLYTPPGRPSASDIRIFAERLQAIADDQSDELEVLVLGSTPEVRDILAETGGVRVTIIDFVLDMMTSMSSLMSHSTDHETWIRGDWLSAPLPTKYFDVVISDLVLANLPPSAQDELVDRVADVLKPGGHWVNRVDCIDEHTRVRPLETLLSEYEGRHDDQSIVCVVRSAAGLVHWDEVSAFMDWSALGVEIETLLADPLVRGTDREKMLQAVWQITSPFDKPYWLLRKEELVRRAARRFSMTFESVDPAESAQGERGYYIWDLVVA